MILKSNPEVMKIVFRVDASIKMGTGHVMRNLTLANELRERGCECSFICRAHEGHLTKQIERAHFEVHVLSHNSMSTVIDDNDAPKNDSSTALDEEDRLFHAEWLEVTQQQDAHDCLPLLKKLQPDWLVVDHYALDKNWQQVLTPYCLNLMVIDDLGDREHMADLLLDQNYGSTIDKYKGLVPKHCKMLTGTRFALLRPEFALWREDSLKRRSNHVSVNHILITLGGVDPDNYTEQILHEMSCIQLPQQIEITVVMGATAPFLERVKGKAASMAVKTTVKINASNMAELMSTADLAIGAAGATTWERCCLGLPTIQIVTAENQRQIAEDLARDNAIKLLRDISELNDLIVKVETWISSIALRTQLITDGLGVKRVVSHMLEGYKQ